MPKLRIMRVKSQRSPSRAMLLLVFKPVLLVVLACQLLLFPTSGLVFTGVVAISSALVVRDLCKLCTGALAVRFSLALAVSILLGYGLGSLIFLVSNATMQADKFQTLAYVGLVFSQSGLAIAFATSLAAASLLYIAAAFERPVNARLGSEGGENAERLVWLGLALVALTFFTGDLAFQGISVSDRGQISAFGAIADLMITGLVPYTVFLACGNCGRFKRVLLIVVALLFISALAVLHRRYLIYAFVLSAIAIQMRGFRFNSKRGLTIYFFSGILALLLLAWGFNFFMALRIAGWDLADASLLERSRVAWSLLVGGESSIVSERLSENFRSRTFILSYLAGLMDVTSPHMPALGSELLYSLRAAVPSVLMPGKTSALPGAPEDFIHPRYGIPVFDGPNSVLVAGFDDFGYFGALIYPLLFVLIYRTFYTALQTTLRDGPVRIFALFVLLFQLFYIEQTIASVFVTLRNLMIVIGVAWLVGKLPAPRLRRRARASLRITAY